jgi:Chromosome segregation ATPases
MESMGLNKLRKEWEETTQKVYSLRDKKKELENQIEKLKSKVESHKIRVFQIESEKSALEKEFHDKKSEIENIKSEIDSLTKQLSELWKGLKGQEEERERLINTISNLKDQLKNLRYEEDNINRQTTLLLQDKAKAEQKIADLEEEIILLKEEYSGEPIEEDVKEIEKN